VSWRGPASTQLTSVSVVTGAGDAGLHAKNDAKHLLQPSYYRNLINAVWSGLQATGHRNDTILVGETANVGIFQPLPFIRSLYCLSSSYRPLTGQAASLVNCPSSGNRSKFVAANPGLFRATGFAHHPYAFDTPPNRRYPDPSWITLENISALEGALNRIFATYGAGRRGGGVGEGTVAGCVERMSVGRGAAGMSAGGHHCGGGAQGISELLVLPACLRHAWRHEHHIASGR